VGESDLARNKEREGVIYPEINRERKEYISN